MSPVKRTEFPDRLGYLWDLDFDLQQAWEIEEYDFQGQAPKVQLIPPAEDLFTQRMSEGKTAFGMAYVILRPQFERAYQVELAVYNQLSEEEKKQIPPPQPIKTELDFAKRLDGSSIQRMKAALWEALVNFFPESATTLRALIERYSSVQQKTDARLAGEVSRVLSDGEIDKILNEAVAKAEEKIATIRMVGK